MLDIKYIKENPQDVIDRLALKGRDAKEEIAEILKLDGERRALIQETETLKAEQNRTSKLIPQYKKEGKHIFSPFQMLSKNLSPQSVLSSASRSSLVSYSISIDFFFDECDILTLLPSVSRARFSSSFI